MQASRRTGTVKQMDQLTTSEMGNTSVQKVWPSADCCRNQKATGRKRTEARSHVPNVNNAARRGVRCDRYGGTTMHLCLSMLKTKLFQIIYTIIPGIVLEFFALPACLGLDLGPKGDERWGDIPLIRWTKIGRRATL